MRDIQQPFPSAGLVGGAQGGVHCELCELNSRLLQGQKWVRPKLLVLASVVIPVVTELCDGCTGDYR